MESVHPIEGFLVVARTNGEVIALGDHPSIAEINSACCSSATAPEPRLEGTAINDDIKIVTNFGASAFIGKDGMVKTFGEPAYGGDSSSVASSLTSGVVDVVSTVTSLWSHRIPDGSQDDSYIAQGGAFAALKSDGSVVTWGDTNHGGDSSSVATNLTGVSEIASTDASFAALKSNGSVVTWGNSSWGGDSSSVASSLTSGVTKLYSNYAAFAALKSDGSVVTWGDSKRGGDSSSVSTSLASGVLSIFSTRAAFAALKSDGSVVTWGSSFMGGDSSSVASELSSGVSDIASTLTNFAAIKSDGSVAVWGNTSAMPGSVASELTSGVSKIVGSTHAFAALKTDGSVLSWGSSDNGGDSSQIESSLSSDVVKILSNYDSFAALKSDGTVLSWGAQYADSITTGVSDIFSHGNIGIEDRVANGVIKRRKGAFAALKSDGSVFAWGSAGTGGGTDSVDSWLTGVEKIHSAGTRFFVAEKTDGSLAAWGFDPMVAAINEGDL